MDDNYPAPRRPDDLYESSIADPDPQDVTAVTHVDTYRIVKETSIRGMNKLFDSVGYSYTVKRRNGHCTTWRCSLRSKTVNCPATVRQEEGVFCLVPGNTSTNLGAAIVASITYECKSKADASIQVSWGDCWRNDRRIRSRQRTMPCPAQHHFNVNVHLKTEYFPVFRRYKICGYYICGTTAQFIYTYTYFCTHIYPTQLPNSLLTTKQLGRDRRGPRSTGSFKSIVLGRGSPPIITHQYNTVTK